MTRHTANDHFPDVGKMVMIWSDIKNNSYDAYFTSNFRGLVIFCIKSNRRVY